MLPPKKSKIVDTVWVRYRKKSKYNLHGRLSVQQILFLLQTILKFSDHGFWVIIPYSFKVDTSILGDHAAYI